jgi:hypothetical protein
MKQFELNGMIIEWDNRKINITDEVPFIFDFGGTGAGWNCKCNRVVHSTEDAMEHISHHAKQKINRIVDSERKKTKHITFVDMFENSEDSFDTEDIFPCV